MRFLTQACVGAVGLCGAIYLSVSAAHGAMTVPMPGADAPGPVVTVAADSTVKRLQRTLNRAGYDAGPADGVMGRRTRNAIRAYQRDKGLPVTGEPSDTLVRHVRSTASARPAISARQVQHLLGRLGFDVPVTGRLDRRTRKAIRLYQQDYELHVSGRPSRKLVSHMNAQIGREQRKRQFDVNESEIADIQRGLRARGYATGGVTGSVTPKTRDAIREFQTQRRLAVDGKPSKTLAAMLRVGVGPADYEARSTVRAVQAALNEKGYAAGPADGAMGPATRRAIERYRTAEKLPEGERGITAALLQSLGLKGDDIATGSYPVRIRDDFEDGDFEDEPAWKVLSQDFRVEDGRLSSSVPAGAGRDAVGGALLVGTGETETANPKAAAIAQPTPFENAFAISLTVRGGSGGRAYLDLGPYQGRGAARGYRLVYDPASDRPLTLKAVGEDGARLIAGTARVPDLADEEIHEVVWRRNARGEMTVRIDGDLALAVRDDGFRDGFSGFSVINGGGEWQLDEVTVRAAGG